MSNARKLPFLVVLAALFAPTLFARAAEPGSSAPHVQIERIDALEWHDNQASVDLTLRIQNPKGVAVPLSELRLHWFIADAPVATAQSRAGVTLPANGSALVPMHVQIDSAATLVVAGALASSGSVPYRIEGTAEIGATGIVVPFEHSGSLELNGASALPRAR
jgi:LEA14-like dessication related protein